MKKDNTLDAKERILVSAINIFIDKGKYGARMQEIADKAEINKAMLHYYFTDKDTLYEKSIEYIFTNLFLRVTGIIEKEAAPLDNICKFVAAYIDFLTENIGITRLIIREMADGAQVFKKIMGNLTRQESIFIPLRLKNFINEAKKNGEIRDIDTVQTIISILGMSVFYFISKPVMDYLWNVKPEKQEKFIKSRKESIVDFIIHGLKTNEPQERREAQRHKGTKAQRHRGSESEK